MSSKQIFLFALIFVLIESCNLSTTQSANDSIEQHNFIEAKTNLEFSNKIHDFGTVRNDTIIYAVFNFKNVGKEKLIIKSVHPDCICTGFILSSDTILPGEDGYVKLNLDTKNKAGKIKAYTIVSANTEIGMYKLTLKGIVE